VDGKREDRAAALAGLVADSHLLPLEGLPESACGYARGRGFSRVDIYLADLERESLRLLPGPAAAAAEGVPESVRIEGTVAGRAYQYGQILPGTPPAEYAPEWWMPLLSGTERLGLLRVSAGHEVAAPSELVELATLVALIIASKRDSSDALARLVRTKPLGLAAEMQWTLLPPRTYADDHVVVSAVMEPAYDVSGDFYEYAVDGPLVHLAILDAMGHDTAAGLSGALALSACRYARRQGHGLVSATRAVEEALVEQYGGERYVTGVLATLDTSTGVLSWVSRGHFAPMVVRGGRWVTVLDCPPGPPMGMGLEWESTECSEQLEPGDRVVLYTDGITEARRAGAGEFGVERFTEFLVRHHADDLPVAETLRRLIRTVTEYHGGSLSDDATVLVCALTDAESAARTAGVAGLPRVQDTEGH
jgi:serine phosphatase RsbU (regulator of sigma subunit)